MRYNTAIVVALVGLSVLFTAAACGTTHNTRQVDWQYDHLMERLEVRRLGFYENGGGKFFADCAEPFGGQRTTRNSLEIHLKAMIERSGSHGGFFSYVFGEDGRICGKMEVFPRQTTTTPPVVEQRFERTERSSDQGFVREMDREEDDFLREMDREEDDFLREMDREEDDERFDRVKRKAGERFDRVKREADEQWDRFDRGPAPVIDGRTHFLPPETTALKIKLVFGDEFGKYPGLETRVSGNLPDSVVESTTADAVELRLGLVVNDIGFQTVPGGSDRYYWMSADTSVRICKSSGTCRTFTGVEKMLARDRATCKRRLIDELGQIGLRGIIAEAAEWCRQ